MILPNFVLSISKCTPEHPSRQIFILFQCQRLLSENCLLKSVDFGCTSLSGWPLFSSSSVCQQNTLGARRTKKSFLFSDHLRKHFSFFIGIKVTITQDSDRNQIMHFEIQDMGHRIQSFLCTVIIKWYFIYIHMYLLFFR